MPKHPIPGTKNSAANNSWLSWAWRYLWMAEMFAIVLTLAALFTAKRRGAETVLTGTIGAAILGPTCYATAGHWKEKRELFNTDAKYNSKRTSTVLAQCKTDLQHGHFYAAEQVLVPAKQQFEQWFGGSQDNEVSNNYLQLCSKLAYVYYMQNKYNAALEVLDNAVLKVDADCVEGLNLKALILFKLDDTKNGNTAKLLLEKSLKIDRNQNDVYLLHRYLDNDAKRAIASSPFDDKMGDEPLAAGSFLQEKDRLQIVGLAYVAQQNYQDAVIMFYSAVLNLDRTMMAWLDKAYFLIKACDAALLLLTPKSVSNADTAAAASPPATAQQASDAKSPTDLKLGSKVITLLDNSKVIIDNKFIKAELERATGLLEQYKKYDPENERIAFIEALMGQLKEKLNPNAVGAVPSLIPKG